VKAEAFADPDMLFNFVEIEWPEVLADAKGESGARVVFIQPANTSQVPRESAHRNL